MDETTRRLRVVACAGLTALVLACGPAAPNATPTAPAPPEAATPQADASPPSIAAPTGSPVATSPPASPQSGARLIDPGTDAPGPPLEVTWELAETAATREPFNPAVDPEGRIWVAAAPDNQFMIFDRDGSHLETWGESGADEGQLNFRHPWADIFGGIAFANDGSFYVVEGGNRRVQKFDAQRNFLFSFGSFGPGDDQFLAPVAIALDGAGNVYVHDADSMVVKMFTSDGEFVRTFAEGGAPWVTVSDDGHVYAQMLEENVLNEYAPDGELVRSIDLQGLARSPRVAGVAIDDEGKLWVSSVEEQGEADVPDKLFVLDTEGKLVYRWDGLAATHFALDPAGDRLYATFFGNPALTAYELPDE